MSVSCPAKIQQNLWKVTEILEKHKSLCQQLGKYLKHLHLLKQAMSKCKFKDGNYINLMMQSKFAIMAMTEKRIKGNSQLEKYCKQLNEVEEEIIDCLSFSITAAENENEMFYLVRSFFDEWLVPFLRQFFFGFSCDEGHLVNKNNVTYDDLMLKVIHLKQELKTHSNEWEKLQFKMIEFGEEMDLSEIVIADMNLSEFVMADMDLSEFVIVDMDSNEF